ncbi:folate-binding protein [uncultured Roseibium sp.]|uniref:CAF17-like 4Fe-4S cluster assembly/insertion protein YgfZ n=1 Tax=uncultured Roseibium sp. TaxID=1936171 RepID=UPI002637F9E7|nr:folate-binding protein [uncultured Roseibium sp.]
MPTAKTAHLSDRSLIRVAGEEAHHFLQNLVTADIEDTDAKGASSAALLTPQGKILFDFLIYKVPGGYLLDAPASIAGDLLKRLTFYRLRSKVELDLLGDDTCVYAIWNGAVSPDGALLHVTDPRLPDLGGRVVGPAGLFDAQTDSEAVSVEGYDAHRIASGVPEGLKDYEYSDIFPHDADLDQLGGVSFTKGCYVGQEVVSRVQHRGTARKRFVLVEGADALPVKGTPVLAGDKAIGELGSAIAAGGRNIGLALLRLDKTAQAKDNGTPFHCGDTEIQVSIPGWATFALPEQVAAD